MRGYWGERHGRRVWVEDGPDACPCGYTGRMLPGWDPHPPCGYACRSWRCPACQAMTFDDEHECRR